MITSTKILVQPPYRGAFSLSYAEADARLAFYLTYFDKVIPLAFNPSLGIGTLIASSELEQQFALSEGEEIFQFPQVKVGDLNDIDFLDGMATAAIHSLNETSGGFALAAREGFTAQTSLRPADRVSLILQDALPSPHHNTPLADILAFKREHEAELRAFHKALDDLYYGLGSRPIDSLLPRFRDDLDRHVDSTLKAYEARGIRSYMGVLKVGLKVVPAAIGEILGSLSGVPLAGTLLGGTIGWLAEKTVLPTDSNSVPKDFEYVIAGLAQGHSKAFPLEAPMVTDVWGPSMTNCIVGTHYPQQMSEPTRSDLRGTSITNSALA